MWKCTDPKEKKRIMQAIGEEEKQTTFLAKFGLVWFLCLMAYQLFLGYLMSKPFS